MFAGYLRDLTERKLAEQSMQRLAAIIENSNDAIIAVKPGGEVIAWNPGAERLLGYTTGEALGTHFSAFYLDEDLRGGLPDRELAAALSDGTAHVLDFKFK